jgi:hypothetical protein
VSCDQDCKEFQGELFGISNLFRDLSDKLFTSDIVELHRDSNIDENKKRSLLETGVSEDEKEEEVMCSYKPEMEKPILKDLGKNKTDLCSSILDYIFLSLYNIWSGLCDSLYRHCVCTSK